MNDNALAILLLTITLLVGLVLGMGMNVISVAKDCDKLGAFRTSTAVYTCVKKP